VMRVAARRSEDGPFDRTAAPTAPAIAAEHTGRLAANVSNLSDRLRPGRVALIKRTEKAGQAC